MPFPPPSSRIPISPFHLYFRSYNSATMASIRTCLRCGLSKPFTSRSLALHRPSPSASSYRKTPILNPRYQSTSTSTRPVQPEAPNSDSDPIQPTAVKHSHLPPRSSAFTKLTKDHISALRKLLSSPGSLLSTIDGSATVDEFAPFNNDWMGKYHGKSSVVVKPKTTKEVGEVVGWCSRNGVAVVPQGGNTGLVGECDFSLTHRS